MGVNMEKSELESMRNIVNIVDKLKAIFGINIFPKKEILVSDTNKPLPKFVAINDMEFS